MSLTFYTDRFWISPYAFTVFVALVEKKLSFDAKEVGLDRADHRNDDFLKISVTGRVPALEHDGFVLAESSAIAEYIDEAFGPRSLMPGDVKDRARARQIMAFIRSDLMPIREERPTTTMFFERATAPLSEKGEAAAEKLLRVASAVIGAGPYLAPEFSLADADLAFMLQRLILNGHAVPERVRAYVAGVWERPSVRAFVVRDRAPYVPYQY